MRKAMEYESEVSSQGNTGEHTEGLKKLDEKALDDPSLIRTMQGRLDNLNQLSNKLDEVDDDDSTSTPDVPEDNNDVEDNDQAVVEDASDDDSSGVDDGKDGKVTPVGIPDALVRAAIHQGWKQEDVDALVKANPELALRTLTNNYNSTVNANREWSALGRAKIQEQRAALETQANVQEQPELTPLEISKLKEDYADDPVVARLISNAERRSTQPRTYAQQPADLYRTATARANVTADSNTDQLINSFFSSDDMSPYKEFYGKVGMSQSVNDLTNGQQEHRLAVLEHAEQIMTGMRMRNFNPTVPEVLEKAHLIVTEPIREQVIRDSLKKGALQRKSGMTFRPSKSKKSGAAVSTNGQQTPRNRQELESKVGQKLASVFGNS